MEHEYEMISHGRESYHLFLVNMLYRTPHLHLDFEFQLVLQGTVDVILSGERITLNEGDLCIINPLQSHEFRASSPALLLALQLPPAFCSSVCPRAEQLEFDTIRVRNDSLRTILLNLAIAHFRDGEWDSLYCYSQVCRFFYELIRNTKHHVRENQTWKQAVARGDRLRHILDYIDTHYSEKITLQDIADDLGVSTYYLSHYFKDAMGISLQECVMRIRCEQARRLLLTTDDTALDISLICGFSDPKYFTQGFRKQYGLRPGEYRRVFKGKKIREQQSSMLSTQHFMSDEASIVILDRYLSHSSERKDGASANE